MNPAAAASARSLTRPPQAAGRRRPRPEPGRRRAHAGPRRRRRRPRRKPRWRPRRRRRRRRAPRPRRGRRPRRRRRAGPKTNEVAKAEATALAEAAAKQSSRRASRLSRRPGRPRRRRGSKRSAGRPRRRRWPRRPSSGSGPRPRRGPRRTRRSTRARAADEEARRAAASRGGVFGLLVEPSFLRQGAPQAGPPHGSSPSATPAPPLLHPTALIGGSDCVGGFYDSCGARSASARTRYGSARCRNSRSLRTSLARRGEQQRLSLRELEHHRRGGLRARRAPP